MRVVAKCSAFVHLSYQVHVQVFNPIPLIRGIYRVGAENSNENNHTNLCPSPWTPWIWRSRFLRLNLKNVGSAT